MLTLGITPVIKARPEAILAEIKYNKKKAIDRKDVEMNVLPLEKVDSEEAEAPSMNDAEASSANNVDKAVKDEDSKAASTPPPAYCID